MSDKEVKDFIEKIDAGLKLAEKRMLQEKALRNENVIVYTEEQGIQHIKIIEAEYVKDYILRLTFSNGEIRTVDFTPLMQKGICRKLQNMDYFRNFTLDPFTVDWNNEIGFAPRYLYERSALA